MNFRDSEISARKKAGTITTEEIGKIKKMNPRDAKDYLYSMNFRDSEISARKKAGTITTEEIGKIIIMDPRDAKDYLYSMNFRDSEISARKKAGTITTEEIGKIIIMDPRDVKEYWLEKNLEKNAYYVVKKSDTLWGIVKEIFSSKSDYQIYLEILIIIELNPHLNKDYLRVKNGFLEKGKDGIPGDLLTPGDKIKLYPTKKSEIVGGSSFMIQQEKLFSTKKT